MEPIIKKAKNLYKTLGELQKEWDVFSKHNSFGRSFWKIDRKINSLWKEVNKLPFNTYPMRSMDDLLGYIEFHEINNLQ